MLAGLLARHYALSGTIQVLSSEVEHTAGVGLPDGRRLILKTSARPEAIDSFRFQSAAIAAVDGAGGFVAPRILRTTGGALMFEEDGVSGYLQTRVVGTPMHQAPRTPDLLRDAGKALGQLDRALNGRDLPAMYRPVLWHIGCWSGLIELEQYLPPGPVAASARRAMADYAQLIEPRIGDVAWQVAHNDPSPFNTLVTDDGIAFIDFGDGCWGPRIQDLAIAASHVVSDPSLPSGRSGASDRGLRLGASAFAAGSDAARRVDESAPKRADPHQLLASRPISRRRPIHQEERGARRARAVHPGLAGRGGHGGRAPSNLSNRLEPMSVDLMPNRYTPGEADVPQREAELIARRDVVLGSSYRLQYRRPVHFVRGDGMWLYDPDGRAYLDFYNNVPSLGHCHPEVNAAMAEQAGRISANTRYLEPRLVDYAERLVATFPKELDRVVFTCTGSESNDLALRIARLISGHDGVIVSSYAYHGTSAATAMVSPNLGDAVKLSPSVRMVTLPGRRVYRNRRRRSSSKRRCGARSRI